MIVALRTRIRMEIEMPIVNFFDRYFYTYLQGKTILYSNLYRNLTQQFWKRIETILVEYRIFLTVIFTLNKESIIIRE